MKVRVGRSVHGSIGPRKFLSLWLLVWFQTEAFMHLSLLVLVSVISQLVISLQNTLPCAATADITAETFCELQLLGKHPDHCMDGIC